MNYQLAVFITELRKRVEAYGHNPVPGYYLSRFIQEAEDEVEHAIRNNQEDRDER